MADLYPRMLPTDFFNYVNNMTPILVCDFRSKEEYLKHHIKDAIHMDPETCVDMVNQEFRMGFSQRKYMLIFVTSSLVSNVATQYLQQLRRESFDPSESVISISFLDYDDVFSAYQSVPGIISSSSEAINITYPSEIIPQVLYLGGYIDQKDSELLNHLRITHIVDATGAQMSKELCGDRISYLPVNIWDIESADISQHFEECNAFVSSAAARQGRILIHCRAGVSRSTSLVLAYLLFSKRFNTLSEAVSHVAKCRPWIIPNESFRKQLMEYELQVRGAQSLSSDEEFVKTIENHAVHWINTASYETDMDRKPIVAGRGLTPAFNVDPYPSESEANVPQKPKKPYLKRGEKRAKS